MIGDITGSSNFELSTMRFSFDNKILALGGCSQYGEKHGAPTCIQGDLILWNVEANESFGQPINIHNGDVNDISFDPNGKILASGSFDETIVLWDIQNNRLVKKLTESDQVFHLTFSPNGKVLASETFDHITLWNLDTYRPIAKLNIENISNSNLGGLAFSPSGTTLASACSDNTIALWDITTQKLIGQPLKEHTGRITSLAFSPNGKFLISGSEDDTIILWNVTTQEPIGSPLTLHTFPINSLKYKLDGRTLVSGDYEGNIILWDMESGTWIEKACRRAGKNFTQAEWIQYFPGEEYRLSCPQWPAGE